jgi:hypothetical protein
MDGFSERNWISGAGSIGDARRPGCGAIGGDD